MNRTLKAAQTPATSTLTSEATGDLQEQIRRRAYELYEERGRKGGRELDDWLEAESEVVQSRERALAA